MPTIRERSTGTIGGVPVTIFPLQGSQYEYLPFNARVEFAIVGDKATVPAEIDGVTATVFSGSDILQQAGPITNKGLVTAQSRNAVYPDDFLLDDVAAAGERISVQLDIPTGTTDPIIAPLAAPPSAPVRPCPKEPPPASSASLTCSLMYHSFSSSR